MRALLAVLALGLFVTPSLAVDNSDPESLPPQLPVEGRNGSFTRVIPIDIPSFRGIEPDLRLFYDSASGIRNLPPAGAELGVGWSLQGVSAIQRVSGTPAPAPGQNKQPSGRGVPAYGAAGFPADSFILDGTELIACTEVPDSRATPSCASAGASAQVYTSRVETYLRIRQDQSANSWEVTGRDDVKSLYTSYEGGSFVQTFRWLLTSVTDRHGNHVDYGWSCLSGHCTIASIRAYSQGTSAPASEIVFHAEARPDPITYGTGLGIRTMTRRISVIEVRSAGSLQAAYGLVYETSASTGLSRLTEVRKFGSDAAISGGSVTGGTALPRWRMSYSNNGDANGRPAFTKREDWSGPGVSAIKVIDKPRTLFESLNAYSITEELVGDFNGDGWAADHYLPRRCLAGSIKPSPGANPGNRPEPIKPGFLCIGDRLRLADGNPAVSTFELLNMKNLKPGKLPESDNISAVGDFNGDGAAELARADSDSRRNCGSSVPESLCPTAWVFARVGAKKFVESQSGSGFHPLDKKQFKLDSAAGASGDFDGDGKDDFLIEDGRIALSGRGQPAIVKWGLNAIAGFEDKYRFLIGDFNGDNRSDVLVNKKKTQTYRIYLSTGSGLVAQAPFNLPSNASRQALGDVNGDGLTDLIYSSAQQVGVLFSDGRNVGDLSSGQAARSDQFTREKIDAFGLLQFRMGDFNGDGRVDIAGSPKGQTGAGTGIARSIGTGFESDPTVVPGRRMITVVADYNGDGTDDLGRAIEPLLGSEPLLTDNFIWLSTSGPADLMTSFREPLGGLVSVTYGSSARERATLLPFIMQVVKSLTLDDGRGGVSTLSFDYEGGLWSREERQFMGFRKVRTSLPCIAGESACPQ